MILILSINADHSTDEIMDWINRLGGKCLRLNDSDVIDKHSLFIDFNKRNIVATVDFYGKKVRLGDVKVVWYRKFGFYNHTRYNNVLKDKRASIDLNQYISTEYQTFLSFIQQLLIGKKWLFKPGNKLSKTHQLITAKRVGLKIPPTIITNDKKSLTRFKNKKRKIISKPMKDVSFFRLNDKAYIPYTELIDDNAFESLNHRFFPSLIQGYIDKQLEIRTFFLNNKLYSMAIFSQNQENTKTDFRYYNHTKPERCVPYQLPLSMERKLALLMKNLKLNTGSIDLIKDKQGKYIFLEVNPAGQFGMISQPCNYPIEKEIAKYLINESQ